MVKPYIEGKLRKSILKSQISNDIATFAGGLNTYVDKAFIDADQLPYCINMTMTQPPMIRTRDSRQTIVDAMIGDSWTEGTILNMWAYNDKLAYIVIKSGDTVRLKKIRFDNPNYVVTNLQELQNAPEYYMCYANTSVTSYLYVTSDYEKIKITIDFNGEHDVIVERNDNYRGPCAFHKGRMFFREYELTDIFGNRKPTNRIAYSNYLDFENFTPGYDGDIYSTAGDFFVTSHMGDITALRSFDDKLMVFCEHSIHALYGDSGMLENENHFQLVDINNTVGTLKDRYVTVGGGRLFWYGDDKQIYEFTGSYINMISRPTEENTGGIDNIFDDELQPATLSASSNHLYVDCTRNYMFVYDIYNKVWWCEDGGFASITNYSHDTHHLLVATKRSDVLKTDVYPNAGFGSDTVYNFDTGVAEHKPIQYTFCTRVYGADGAAERKTLSKIHFQAVATANVFISDVWSNWDPWHDGGTMSRAVQIGTLRSVANTGDVMTYNDEQYEQQECIVEKMFAERVNTFQIAVAGYGLSKFYLMKREWRVS